MGLFPKFLKRRVDQAHPGGISTPRPLSLDDIDASDLYINERDDLLTWEPSPARIDQLHRKSHEWASVTKRIRNEVWRKPLTAQPFKALWCTDCGEGIQDRVKECPNCAAPEDALRPPDNRTRDFLLERARRVDVENNSVESLGRLLEDDANKHSNTFIVFRFNYELQTSGAIQSAAFQELRRGDPRVMQLVQDKDGHMGGRFYVCLRCRATPKYRPEDQAKPCHRCGGATYDAWYVEAGRNWYLPNEVLHEDDWHYPTASGGESVGVKLWWKAITILGMDKFAAMAFDPKKDKRPGEVLAILGGSKEAVEAWAKDDANRRRKNPYALATLHVPIPAGLGGEASRPDAKVLQLGDEIIKGQSLDIRKEFREAIRNEYGLSPMQAGDVATSGGLNNEGLQLRSTSQIVEYHQTLHQRWIDRYVELLGVLEWRLTFEAALEEEEHHDVDVINKRLDAAQKAKNLGLRVLWKDDDFEILEGEVQAPPMPSFGAGPPGEGGSFSKSMDAEGEDATAPKVEQAAPRNSDQAGQLFRAAFAGPSGAVEALDALYGGALSGLTPEQTQAVMEEIAASLSQPQGWSIQSIQRRIQPVFERAKVDNAEARANLVARVETAAIISEWKIREYQLREEESGVEGVYRVSGADDHRTTKLSRWIRAQVGDGRPLPDVLRVMDQGVALAKAGAFLPGGALSEVQGQAISLPPGFTRRGSLCHYNDRDIIVRAG